MLAAASDNGQVVLVTGINGYIASHIGLQLLHKGYNVRGTSRGAQARDHLLNGAFKGFEKSYQHYVVADMTAAGAFDEAVRGAHGIIHTASPLDFSLKTVDEFMIPAVQGNVSLLESTKLAGSQLKAFVLTSSIAAIADRFRQPPDYNYSEEDWNIMSESKAREHFMAPVAYGASKTAAERALWTFRDRSNPLFACSAVNPGVVTGPPVSWPSTPDGLNSTLKPVWQIFSGEAKGIPSGIGYMTYIDVRDVAALHVWCLEHAEQSDGQRYMVTNGKGTPQAMADILREAYPDRKIVVGSPESDYIPDSFWFPSGETSSIANKAYAAMGVRRFIMFDQSILDTVKAFERKWPELIQNAISKA